MKLITVATEKNGILSRIRFGVPETVQVITDGGGATETVYRRTGRKTPQGHVIFSNQTEPK